MNVELRLRGAGSRLVGVAFEGFDVAVDGGDTVVSGVARDEVEALGLIERARSLGFVVVSWRNVDPPRSAD
jgi:hypothetical protein